MSVKTWIDDLRKLVDPAVVVVVGNKSDLTEQRRVDRAGSSQSCCIFAAKLSVTTQLTFSYSLIESLLPVSLCQTKALRAFYFGTLPSVNSSIFIISMVTVPTVF